MNKVFKTLLSSLAAMLMVVSAYAQFTTSTLEGRVTDPSGEPLTGATVVAIHTPSGSQYYAVANAEGYYTIQGMRPGGPYEITYSFVGCNSLVYNDISLPLGETVSQSASLSTSETLDEVLVVASTTKFTTEKTGASTNVSNSQINSLPSASRSIQDLTKLSPYANGMSFAGSDGRSTNFTVDGANFNNNFGLSSKLPGGGTPISVDALEEVQLVVAPYDVRQSNFVGGGINAVTKSGTNTFKATAYTYYNDEGLRGNIINGNLIGDRKFEQTKIYGLTVGGPIVKNKLFFFVNFEYQNQPEQVIKYKAANPEAMELVAKTLREKYNYEPGSYTDFPGGNNNMKILARLDWNITDAHKLSVRFNSTNNTQWFEPNGNSSDDGYRNKSFNRVSTTSMAFSNNMYSQKNDVWSIAAELNSRFGDKVSNQLIATYSDIKDVRGSNSDIFPHIDIMAGDPAGAPAMSLGYELFTYNNAVKNNVMNLADNVSIYAGAHKITAGLNWERQTASNAYMRNATGYYRFASVEDFINGANPVGACFTIGNNGVDAPNGLITYNQFAVYAQDEWNITRNFKLTYGLRGDLIVYDNSQLMTNKAVLDYDMGGRSIDTGKWPSPKMQVSPRIGFTWDIRGDKSLKLRGGLGLFQGRLPLVFFTNMPQNSGMIQTSVNLGKNTAAAEFAEKIAQLNPGGKLITDVKEMAKVLGVNTTVTPEDGQFQKTINGVDPDFHMPQIAKVSLALDYKLPVSFPFTITAEGMFTKTIYGVRLTDWNINESVPATSTFKGVDNRYNYWALEDVDAKGKISNKQYVYGNDADAAYVLTNTNQGYGWNAALSFDMTPAKNLNITAAYVHTVSKEISGMPGSNASSAYQGLYTVNGCNFATLQNSRYVVPDKLTANVSYYLESQGLHFNLYYNGYSHGTYNYVYANDMNGDGNNADLMYIYPSGAEVNFVEHTYKDKDGNPIATLTAADQAQIYDKFLAQDKYMSKNKGKYAEAHSAISPFISRFDFRVAKDFTFGNKTKHNIQVSASIENIGNMFDSSWGVEKWSCYQTSYDSYNVTPLTYAGEDASGKPQFYMTPVISNTATMPTETFNQYYVDPSQCWKVLLGLKYFFN
ncbi:MAG: TonB-dependent receptor [Bacteroidales bacterium]|nr:TonB-dependent receptor [Bacteroidales bacterium]